MNVRIAFAFLGYSDQQLKDDPRFVKWIVRVSGKKDGEGYERILSYRSCTEEDIASFYPITSAQEPYLDKIKDSLLCIDWDDESPYLSYGRYSDPDWGRLEIILAPCNYVH